MSASDSISLGSGQVTWSSQQGSGYDYTSGAIVSDPGGVTNTTGAISPPSGENWPVLINNFSMTFTNSVGAVKLQLSSSIGGGNRSSTNFSGSGTKSYNPNFATFTGSVFYYGFQKQDSSTVRWYNTSGGTIFGNGNPVTAFGDNRISGSYSYITVPGPVSGLTSTSKTDTTIDLDWSPVSDNGGSSLTGYRIAYRPSGGSWSFQTQGAASQGSISGLSGGTTYEIQVAGLNLVTDTLNSDYSSTSAHTGTESTIFVTTNSSVAPPTFTGTEFPNGQVGESYYHTISASGDSISSLSDSEATFPAGLSGNFSGNTYIVSGTPTNSASSGSIVLSATNPGGTTNYGPDAIFISPPSTPSWNDLTFNQAEFGIPYSDSITASDADYVQASTSSIAGMSVSSSGSTITVAGTPTQSGNFSFTVTAYSVPDNGVRLQSAQTAFITVGQQPIPTWNDIVVNESAELNREYSDGVSASGATLYTIVSGSLPFGISIDSASGQIAGTPEELGTFNFTVRAQNSAGSASPDQSLTISVGFPGANRYTSSTNQFIPIRQTAKRFDDSLGEWQNLSIAKRFNGASWIDL